MVRLAKWVAVLVTAPVLASPVAAAEPGHHPGAPSIPMFVPHHSNWQPDYTVFPYDLWRNRVTPEMVIAERDSCQWINAQYDVVMSQALGFQHVLDGHHDDWSAPGVRDAAGVVAANLDQSAAFLEPRADTLFIVNYPDQSEYSPLFHGDSIYRLWYQFTRISDKIRREFPSGQINANVATAHVYGGVIRESGVCAGA